MSISRFHTPIALKDVVMPRTKRMREPKNIESLAESMRESGQLQAIGVVQKLTKKEGKFVLIYGARRLAAAKLLGWDRLDAYVFGGGDETDYKIFEIEENLRREELTDRQKDEHVMALRKLTESKQGSRTDLTSANSSLSPEDGLLAANAKAAKLLNESPATIKTRVARAEKLAKVPNIGDVTGTTLDNAAGLNALAEIEPKEAEAVVKRVKAGENVTAKSIRKPKAADAVKAGGKPGDVPKAEAPKGETLADKKSRAARAWSNFLRRENDLPEAAYDRVIAAIEAELG